MSIKCFRVKLSALVAGVFFMSLFSCKNDSTQQKKQSATSEERTMPADSIYMGLDDEILKRSTVDEIPADFPKHIKGETKQEFQRRGMIWAKKHLDLVAPEFLDKVRNFKE